MKGWTTLAKTMQELMQERKTTIKAVANKAGVPRSMLGGWLTGVQPQNLGEVRKVARVLGVSFEFLVFGEKSFDLAGALNAAAKEIVLDGYYQIRLQRIDAGKERTHGRENKKAGGKDYGSITSYGLDISPLEDISKPI